MFAVGLHTCTAVARSLCVSGAFLLVSGGHNNTSGRSLLPTSFTPDFLLKIQCSFPQFQRHKYICFGRPHHSTVMRAFGHIVISKSQQSIVFDVAGFEFTNRPCTIADQLVSSKSLAIVNFGKLRQTTASTQLALRRTINVYLRTYLLTADSRKFAVKKRTSFFVQIKRVGGGLLYPLIVRRVENILQNSASVLNF